MATLHLTLIKPPLLFPRSMVYPSRAAAPIGMAYVAAAVKSAGFKVQCIDAFGEDMDRYSSFKDNFLINGLSVDEILNRIPISTDVIGLSCMFSNEWIFIEGLIHAIKSKFPKKFLILGGEHASSAYEYILKNCSDVDGCILGEGEQKIVDLLTALREKAPLGSIEGFAFLCSINNEIAVNSGLKRIKHINSLPRPAWDEIPIRQYLDRRIGFGISGTRSMPMLASRGCPYSCTFCSNPQMWTSVWKSRDVEEVIAEIKEYHRIYSIEHIEFYDLTVIVNRNWIHQFSRRLIEENLGLTWSLPSGTRSEVLDSETLILLKQAGLKKMTYAPESGSVRILKMIKKKIRLKSILSSMRNAVKNGIVVKATLISGFPKENYFDLICNFVFITGLAIVGINDLAYFCFSPYPGSELFDELVKSGKIKKDKTYYEFLSLHVNNNPFRMKSWSSVIPSFLMPVITIGGTAYFYFLQFLFRPWRLIAAIHRLINRTPLTMLDLTLKTLLFDMLLKERFNKEYN